MYTLRDPETGEVLRTGRTVDLAQRAAQHANDPVLGDLEFQAEYRTDVYAEQRGLEQVLYDRYPGAQAANGGFNKIGAISPSNPNLPTYMQGRVGLPRTSGVVMAKVKYAEGDWFAVPLREGGFGIGVVARTNPDGVLLGYFFGPRRDEPPSLDEVADLKPTDAVMVRKFGHLGLTQGKWPVIGRAAGWDRHDWPMPVFVRYEELTGRSFRVFYDDSDPNKLVREEQVDPGAGEQGPKDGLLGAGAVEKVLTAQLR